MGAKQQSFNELCALNTAYLESRLVDVNVLDDGGRGGWRGIFFGFGRCTVERQVYAAYRSIRHDECLQQKLRHTNIAHTANNEF